MPLIGLTSLFIIIWPLTVQHVAAVEGQNSSLPVCQFSRIETGVKWSQNLERLSAVAIIRHTENSADPAEEKNRADKAVLTAKTMLGRYQFGLDAKRFRLSGVFVDFVCELPSGGTVAQVSK